MRFGAWVEKFDFCLMIEHNSMRSNSPVDNTFPMKSPESRKNRRECIDNFLFREGGGLAPVKKLGMFGKGGHGHGEQQPSFHTDRPLDGWMTYFFKATSIPLNKIVQLIADSMLHDYFCAVQLHDFQQWFFT